MQYLACDRAWMETYLDSLQFQENTMLRVQQLHFELAHVLSEMLERRLQATLHERTI